MAEPRTLILVQSAKLRDALQALAAELPWAPARGVCFDLVSGEVQRAVADRRAREGGIPIGVITDDEAAALAALSGGADEAVARSALDAPELTAFADRLELRARLRAESQRLQQTFAHAEKLTALGTLVAGIGHEINNPLAAMVLSIDAARYYLQPALHASWEIARAAGAGRSLPETALEQLMRLQALQERTGRDATRVFDDIAGSVDSIASIVRDLRVFARADHEEPLELCEVEDVVGHALRLTGRELSHSAILERDFAPHLPKLVVPRNRLTQVIVNVLINAAHAIREIERPAHRIRISVRADEAFVAIAISDTGPGIPTESLDRIFDPFFTTKRHELGTGLGLAISRSILQSLGGDLSVESVYGDGATFVCFVPIPSVDSVKRAYERSSPRPSPPSPRPPHCSVLVVDDDERVLRAYMRLLNPEHRVMIAQDGTDAIELLESGSVPDVILVELDLPGVDGCHLLEWLGEHRPELRRRAVVVTSAGSQAQYDQFLRAYSGPVLYKPVRGEQLLAEIARVL